MFPKKSPYIDAFLPASAFLEATLLNLNV
jgi:hypothetical protein